MKKEKEFLVDLVKDDYRLGYKSGYERKSSSIPQGVDGLSFSSGYIEGKADRLKGKGNKYDSL